MVFEIRVTNKMKTNIRLSDHDEPTSSSLLFYISHKQMRHDHTCL